MHIAIKASLARRLLAASSGMWVNIVRHVGEARAVVSRFQRLVEGVCGRCLGGHVVGLGFVLPRARVVHDRCATRRLADPYDARLESLGKRRISLSEEDRSDGNY